MNDTIIGDHIKGLPQTVLTHGLKLQNPIFFISYFSKTRNEQDLF